jgi:2-desacetyl-2-hydroxyethyl bacteriochlorophyllide A dehydrogenase
MKAIQFEKPGSARVIDTAEPPAPREGEALVRVRQVGVCGTDYGGYLGKMPFFSYPRIPGHELGVEVVATGPGVANVAPGDRCSVEPYISCYACHACARGHTNCCENNQTLGVHCDGGLRPLFLVPARKLHRSRNLSFEQLALVETLAIGRHAVNRGAPTSSESVLILGAGPIGLSAFEFARLSGARTLVMDVNPDRLAFVRDRMGATRTLLARGDDTDFAQAAEAAGGHLPEVVIDATGSHQSMSRALEFCSFAGRLVYVGITPQTLSFPHAPVLHRRELTLLASRNALPEDFTAIIQLIEEGRIDTNPWITHRAAFNEFPALIESYLKPEARVIKAMVAVE